MRGKLRRCVKSVVVIAHLTLWRLIVQSGVYFHHKGDTVSPAYWHFDLSHLLRPLSCIHPFIRIIVNVRNISTQSSYLLTSLVTLLDTSVGIYRFKGRAGCSSLVVTGCGWSGWLSKLFNSFRLHSLHRSFRLVSSHNTHAFTFLHCINHFDVISSHPIHQLPCLRAFEPFLGVVVHRITAVNGQLFSSDLETTTLQLYTPGQS